jgi:hypothetical protein
VSDFEEMTQALTEDGWDPQHGHAGGTIPYWTRFMRGDRLVIIHWAQNISPGMMLSVEGLAPQEIVKIMKEEG